MGLAQICTTAALVTFLAYPRSSRDTYFIDTFDRPDSLSAWRISGDASVELGSGYRGPGAALHYRVSREAPVLVVWQGSMQLPKFRNPVFSIWARFPGDVQVTLQATDSSGYEVLLPIEATLEHPHANEWRYASCRLKHKITRVALSIRTLGNTTVQGELDFDELTLRSGDGMVRFSPAEPSSEVPASVKQLPPIGVNVHLLRDEPSLDSARAAGFAFVRMDLLWRNVERRGRFRFLAYDLFLRSVQARGMGVLWILDYGHPEHGGDVPRTPDDLQAFDRYAQAVAEHFRGQNVRYEIWNEPNNPQFWAGSPDPVEYRTLLNGAAVAMRSADPSAIISSGGVSNMDLLFLSRVLDRNALENLTAISVHPYPKGGPETIVSGFSDIQSWTANQAGKGIEIWDSEWGYSSTLSNSHSELNGHNGRDRERQANLATREVLTVWGLGFSLGVWYDLRDDGNDPANPEQNYGLLDTNGREKPAMQAIRNLMTSAKSRKFMGMLPEPPYGIHAARFDGTNDELVIVWTDTAERDTTLEIERRDLISATDFMGRAIKVKSGSKGTSRITISEHAGPVYLSFRIGSRLPSA